MEIDSQVEVHVHVYIFQSGCVYLYLCRNGAFSVFPSSQLFSVSRSSQNIESVLSEMEVLQQKFKDLPGSSLEKLKKLHSEVFSKVTGDDWWYFLTLRIS